MEPKNAKSPMDSLNAQLDSTRAAAAAEKTRLTEALTEARQLLAGSPGATALYRDDQLVRQFAARNNCADLTADLSRLVTGAADNTVRIWDVETGNQLLVFDEPIYSVSQVHFLHGDERIIALSHRWDAPTYIYVWSAPRD